ncbi:MAG: hypothetical protein DBX47_04415 [Clostridiales bacterium]|nr:MAG: hypothetical protein DBX47_04415 [Clostridiales bacterium]
MIKSFSDIFFKVIKTHLALLTVYKKAAATNVTAKNKENGEYRNRGNAILSKRLLNLDDRFYSFIPVLLFENKEQEGSETPQ